MWQCILHLKRDSKLEMKEINRKASSTFHTISETDGHIASASTISRRPVCRSTLTDVIKQGSSLSKNYSYPKYNTRKIEIPI